ncbi:Rossmann-fold NAD(P)-binding domain-containing protein [Verminephrobacter aporrectodeae]|uniref:hypothetical protein n=1 Tax=Verminephrobacter aporrectodeae TaxID=1110389 RepID=UPI0022372925|nr:hypothetical protein [Verminephrobacter aporrectodeae]MCW5220864.1 hypothetical protein [Verminephrobacter aporrectodeae subsp. tuberculatae]MCW5290159.1 hypothetical protein [Verminephrobacter aporrectodeae subsp. tuberculatae]MCW8174497.1 hypothetical protein [Verminephrobacter aporrectodeae subsp. tuberculatae]MCW8197845.1 hypothetical protein [Verminephrobacter aporrectodeae subsp. tuberculatae]MCW8202211.1 hypothetical protein [Verminephrobacter aporrectodeae subsp. tuberculatae]
MLLKKTEKARLELSPGMRTLSLRERSLLLLAQDKPLCELQAMYDGGGAQIVESLLRQGYLTASFVRKPKPGSPARSLAGARMYLFDICERLFARRDPAQAQHFREALRAAKDPVGMLDVGNALFEEVTLAAGAERAAALRERFRRLLPHGVVHHESV